MAFEKQIFSIPEPSFSYDDYCIVSLMQMGFDEETSRNALKESAGRIDLAIWPSTMP